MNHAKQLIDSFGHDNRDRFQNGITLLALYLMRLNEAGMKNNHINRAQGRDARDISPDISPRNDRALYLAHVWSYSKAPGDEGRRVAQVTTSDKVCLSLEWFADQEVVLCMSRRRYAPGTDEYSDCLRQLYRVDDSELAGEWLWQAAELFAGRTREFFSGAEVSEESRTQDRDALEVLGFDFLLEESVPPRHRKPALVSV